MQRIARLPTLVSMVALLCAGGSSISKELPPVPPTLEGVTSVHITVTSCGNEPKRHLTIEKAALVRRLALEMELLRNPTGIEATKFSCDAEAAFFKDGRRVALVHVLPCFAVELAPVSGKRYFQYSGGLRRLPELQNVVGSLGKGAECR